MCSYKAWVWLTAIYSIPLILVLLVSDIVTLVGLNAPKLFSYDIPNHQLENKFIYLSLSNHLNDDEPRLGEVAALKRMSYENQFKRNFDEDSLDGATNALTETNAKLANGLSESEGLVEENLKDDSPEALTDSSKATNAALDENTTKPIEMQTADSLKTEEKNTEINRASTINDNPTNDERKATTVQDDEKEPPNPDEPHDPPKDPEESKEANKNEILKLSWNEFLYGLYLHDNKLVMNIFVIIKLVFRLLSLITLPLLMIGNSTNRSKYIKPFKIILLFQFLFSLGITIYYAIVSTQVNLFSKEKSCLLKLIDTFFSPSLSFR